MRHSITTGKHTGRSFIATFAVLTAMGLGLVGATGSARADQATDQTQQSQHSEINGGGGSSDPDIR